MQIIKRLQFNLLLVVLVVVFFLDHSVMSVWLGNRGNLELVRSMELAIERSDGPVESPGGFPVWNLDHSQAGEHAVQWLQAAVRLTDSDKAACRLYERLAYGYLLKGDAEALLALPVDACQTGWLEYARGVAWEATGNDEMAVQTWRKPVSTIFYFKWAMLISGQKGLSDYTQRAYELQIRIWPDNYDAYYQLAGLYWADSCQEAAVGLLKQVVALDSSDSDQYHMGRGQIAFAAQKWAEAVVEFQLALARNALVPYAHQFAGSAWLELGNLAKAEMEFRAELRVDPNYPWALFGMGKVAYLKGDALLARSYCQKAAILLSQDLHCEQFKSGQ